MKKASFQVSQGLEVLMPKAGKAYPIPCEEWALVKNKLDELTTEPWVTHTIGSILLGAALSMLGTILTGTFHLPEQLNQLIVAWGVFTVAFICGLVCLFFAHQERGLHRKRVSDVIAQMDIIERRYENVLTGITFGQMLQNLLGTQNENKTAKPAITEATKTEEK